MDRWQSCSRAGTQLPGAPSIDMRPAWRALVYREAEGQPEPVVRAHVRARPQRAALHFYEGGRGRRPTGAAPIRRSRMLPVPTSGEISTARQRSSTRFRSLTTTGCSPAASSMASSSPRPSPWRRRGDYLRGADEGLRCQPVQELQCNFTGNETLLDAQKNPELHRNLVVRVSGFSSTSSRCPERCRAT